MVMDTPLLETRDLCVWFPVRRGRGLGAKKGMVRAVDGVSLHVGAGETLGLVGESGCGKSTLARALVLLEKPVSGEVLFEGRPLRGLGARELRRVRPRMQMIFQDPYASLNPRMTVADALAEPMIVHGTVPRAEVPAAVARLMERVGLARRSMRKYPHEFSGGQRQRIAIARALATEPRLVVADEPVSALDVSVQAQIINLLRELQAEMGLAMVFISHDLSVVRHLSRRIAVMYLGRLVEEGPAEAVFAQPRHPYTRALLSAAMTPDPRRERTRPRIPLPGEPPSPIDPPAGCRFHPRCPMAGPECALREPEAEPCGENHRAWCMRLK
jgi:oligopeptide transport system ATP-binding protein